MKLQDNFTIMEAHTKTMEDNSGEIQFRKIKQSLQVKEE